MRRLREGPGIAKARELPILVHRAFQLVHGSDYRVRELFENADVMSEGALRQERAGLVYYGTTSVLLLTRSHGGLVPDEQRCDITRLLRIDPHARLRAVRIACREAQIRSACVIGPLRTEVHVHEDPTGIRFDVDVEASVEQSSTAREGSHYKSPGE